MPCNLDAAVNYHCASDVTLPVLLFFSIVMFYLIEDNCTMHCELLDCSFLTVPAPNCSSLQFAFKFKDFLGRTSSGIRCEVKASHMLRCIRGSKTSRLCGLLYVLPLLEKKNRLLVPWVFMFQLRSLSFLSDFFQLFSATSSSPPSYSRCRVHYTSHIAETLKSFRPRLAEFHTQSSPFHLSIKLWSAKNVFEAVRCAVLNELFHSLACKLNLRGISVSRYFSWW